jgi:hypothetical protein
MRMGFAPTSRERVARLLAMAREEGVGSAMRRWTWPVALVAVSSEGFELAILLIVPRLIEILLGS